VIWRSSFIAPYKCNVVIIRWEHCREFRIDLQFLHDLQFSQNKSNVCLVSNCSKILDDKLFHYLIKFMFWRPSLSLSSSWTVSETSEFHSLLMQMIIWEEFIAVGQKSIEQSSYSSTECKYASVYRIKWGLQHCFMQMCKIYAICAKCNRKCKMHSISLSTFPW
jgi:hypothetical protein